MVLAVLANALNGQINGASVANMKLTIRNPNTAAPLMSRVPKDASMNNGPFLNEESKMCKM